MIGINSKCCKNDAHTRCPSGEKCTNYLGCKVDLFKDHLDVSLKDTYTSDTPHVKHDNTMSALRLHPGCCVTLFDLPNYRGASKRTCSTMSFNQLVKTFGMGWNDKVS